MRRMILFFTVLIFSLHASAEDKECWSLTGVKGVAAYSKDNYAFSQDGYSDPMLLCFESSTQTGSVTGDDTRFFMLGPSTLVGYATNRGIELAEVYQIDRERGKVLFTKSRIGTASLLPGMPDIVGAFVGKAVKIR
jgi:hypothetical protein